MAINTESPFSDNPNQLGEAELLKIGLNINRLRFAKELLRMNKIWDFSPSQEISERLQRDLIFDQMPDLSKTLENLAKETESSNDTSTIMHNLAKLYCILKISIQSNPNLYTYSVESGPLDTEAKLRQMGLDINRLNFAKELLRMNKIWDFSPSQEISERLQRDLIFDQMPDLSKTLENLAKETELPTKITSEQVVKDMDKNRLILTLTSGGSEDGKLDGLLTTSGPLHLPSAKEFAFSLWSDGRLELSKYTALPNRKLLDEKICLYSQDHSSKLLEKEHSSVCFLVNLLGSYLKEQ